MVYSVLSTHPGRARSVVTAILVAIFLSSCASMSGVTGPGQEFVTAVNMLAQAESDYFDEIQAASDTAYRMQATEDYVGHNGSWADVARKLSKHDDFSKAKQLRMAAMRQLQNYAQQIAAISSGASASWIADDANTTTTNVSKLVNDAGAKAASRLLTSHAGVIETAVTKLGQAIIGSESAKELQSLATEAKDPIAKIADMVAEDNANIEKDNFAESLKEDQAQGLRNILHYIYADPKVNSFQRLSAIQMTASRNPALVTKGQAIEGAVQKLEAANNAMAQRQDASASSLVQQAYAYAKHALAAAPNAAK